MSSILLFLGQALILICVPFLLWRVPLVRRAVPLVVVQILVGIALGPSLLGHLAPDLSALVLPPASVARLSSLSWLAVLFFAFLTGMHLDGGEMLHKNGSNLGIGLASMLVPFAGGALLGWWSLDHLPGLAGEKATMGAFIIAMGLCVSVTALPVLGAILHETGLIRHDLGRLALGCAALNDVLLWMVMAALLALMGDPDAGLISFGLTVVLSATYFTVMTGLVRPLLTLVLVPGPEGLRDRHLVLVVAVLLASALAAEAIGLHYLIGAFLAGVVMPATVRAWIVARVEGFTMIVLLPFFFVVTGLNVFIDAHAPGILPLLGASTLVAMAGKVLGTSIPARLCGLPWREALSLGALMQCKGMMEVIVLTVLLEAGLVSGAAFSALILMALVTTGLTMPLVRLLMGGTLRPR